MGGEAQRDAERQVAAQPAVPDRAASAPLPPLQASVLRLQRSAGNAATTSLLTGGLPGLPGATPRPPRLPPVPGAQAQPGGDRQAWRAVSEQLAAVVAERSPMFAAHGGTERLADRIAEDGQRLARAWGGLDGGRALTEGERAPFERSFGHDLSAVRLHAGGSAARAVTSTLGVEALTAGNHIVAAGMPSAGILGHELAHVVQQQRGPRPANDRLRAAAPGSAVETDATRASQAALAGDRYAVGAAGGEDIAMALPLAWLAIAAIVALAGGTGLAVTASVVGPSYEENRRAAEERHRSSSAMSWLHAAWLWVPLGGTATRIWEAQSTFERVFNVILMPVDVLTLGAGAGAFTKIANRSLWERAVAAASEEELAQLGQQGVRVITPELVNAEAQTAVQMGQAVIGTVGGTSHAVVLVRVGDRYYRLSGGYYRSIKITEFASLNITDMNAFHAFGGAGESAAILAEAQQLARGLGPGVGFSFRSCGISAARLAEAGGLNLGLTRPQAFLPITVMGRVMSTAGVVTSHAGARTVLSGTTHNLIAMGVARGGTTVISNPREFAQGMNTLQSLFVGTAQGATPPGGPRPGAPAPNIPAVEVTGDPVQIIQAGGGDGIELTAVPAAYRMLSSRVGPQQQAGQQEQQPIEIIPIYEFVGAMTDEAAERPPGNLNAVMAAGPQAMPIADPRRVLELAQSGRYRTGARNLASSLAGAADRNEVLGRAHDFFPWSFPSVTERDAAIAAVEAAGVTGAELDRATAALSAGGP